jgi:hypothetical protein
LRQGTPENAQRVVAEAERRACRQANKDSSTVRARRCANLRGRSAKFRGVKFGIEIREAVEELAGGIRLCGTRSLKDFPRRMFITGTTPATRRSSRTSASSATRNFIARPARRPAGTASIIHDVKFPARDHFPHRRWRH